MSDTQFVRNEDPHEVSLPEGSKVAKSRSAENPTPVIRQVIVDSDTLNVEEGGATRVSPITPTAQSSTNEPSNGGDAAPMSPASPISHQDSEPKKKRKWHRR